MAKGDKMKIDLKHLHDELDAILYELRQETKSVPDEFCYKFLRKFVEYMKSHYPELIKGEYK